VALVLDSRTIPEGDRVEALNAAFSKSEAPQTVTYETNGPIRHRMDLFDLGLGTHLLRNTGTGLRIVRGPGHVRMGSPEQLAVYIQTYGYGLLSADGDRSVSGAGQLGMLDSTRPYSFRQPVDSKHKVLLIDARQLDLPMDAIRSAGPSLRASPLYELVRAHFTRLYESQADLPPAAAAMLGQATVQLVRALIATAADDIRQHEALHASLLLRITMYIDAHLHDRELNADRIAAVHNISSRPRSGSSSDAWSGPATSSPTSTRRPPSPPSHTAAVSATRATSDDDSVPPTAYHRMNGVWRADTAARSSAGAPNHWRTARYRVR
jgi:AraC family transcriptional activator of tynA and feaB